MARDGSCHHGHDGIHAGINRLAFTTWGIRENRHNVLQIGALCLYRVVVVADRYLQYMHRFHSLTGEVEPHSCCSFIESGWTEILERLHSDEESDQLFDRHRIGTRKA